MTCQFKQRITIKNKKNLWSHSELYDEIINTKGRPLKANSDIKTSFINKTQLCILRALIRAMLNHVCLNFPGQATLWPQLFAANNGIAI